MQNALYKKQIELICSLIEKLLTFGKIYQQQNISSRVETVRTENSNNMV